MTRTTGARGVSRAPLVVGVSGPDGVGKSGLVAGLADSFESRGVAVATTYVYGCVICRRVPPDTGEAVAKAAVARHRSRVREMARFLRRVDGVTDAVELAFRLWLATARLRFSAPRQHGRGWRGGRAGRGTARALSPAVVITDRSPLDGLVKHRPREGSFVWRLFRRLAAHYDAILLLSAPPDVLAARDREHSVEALAAASDRFELAARRVPHVVRISTDGTIAEVLASASAAIEDRL